MLRDDVRIEHNRRAIQDAGFGAVVCALPSNVLLLTGYFPVTGISVAIATPTRTYLLVPSDEENLAKAGWADEVQTFEPASLDWIKPLTEAISPALAGLLSKAGLATTVIGYEGADWVQPSSYAAMHVFGGAMWKLLTRLVPGATTAPAKTCLESLRLTKTPKELDRIRVACGVARRAFTQGILQIQPGQTESQIAAAYRGPLLDAPQSGRADGFAFCMSGPNGANAYKAFQQSTGHQVREGELVLVHCNSHAGGYWTDITRTYSVRQPDERSRRMYEAVFAARQGALKAIRPGASAADVDKAAREVMRSFGFADQFVHPTGHGVGFAAIDHNARPCLHPASDEILQEGMVFNVEPGIYFEGECGMRHCDMVAVTADGAELLTPFQSRPEELVA